MPRSQSLSLPNTKPGGMEAHLYVVPVPVVDDRVIVGPIEIPMREFCQLVEHVLTSSAWKPEDPRARLVDRIANSNRSGPRGERFTILEHQAVAV